jgi:hypothetical protein
MRFSIFFCLIGCSTLDVPTPIDYPTSDGVLLSAYYGLDELPWLAVLPCEAFVGGDDGMPVTFSVRIDDDSLSVDSFAVTTGSGVLVTPKCATLRPATEALERRTVLLAGNFGTPDNPPRGVEVTGFLLDESGALLTGLSTETIIPLASGPSLVLAERYSPATPEFRGECPSETRQIVQLIWDGGVSGPDGADLGLAQREGVHVTLEDQTVIQPVALADDDPDNFVLACLDSATPAQSVRIDEGLFHDPGDDPNPATQTPVVFGHR